MIANATEQREAVSSFFIGFWERIYLPARTSIAMVSLLSATKRMRVEQKFLQFSIEHYGFGEATLVYIACCWAAGCKVVCANCMRRNYFTAFATRFRSGGQSPMLASI